MKKFRVWDIVRHEYLSAGQVLLAIQPGERPADTVLYLDILTYQPPHGRFIIEEFMGRVDKNGVEIYEGDIINNPLWWWGPCFVFQAQGCVGPCHGNNVLQWLLGKNINDPMVGAVYNLWYGKEVTVIGNIHTGRKLLLPENNPNRQWGTGLEFIK